LVDALGELKHVRGASSEEDIGAITEMLDHNGESPCVLFDEIPRKPATGSWPTAWARACARWRHWLGSRRSVS
jgi:hypothetical protein